MTRRRAHPPGGADAWGNAAPAGDAAAPHAAQQSADWLNSGPADAPAHFSLLDPFHQTLIPLDRWVTEGIDWVVLHFRPLFQGIRVPVDFILSGFQHLLLGLPAPVAMVTLALVLTSLLFCVIIGLPARYLAGA